MDWGTLYFIPPTIFIIAVVVRHFVKVWRNPGSSLSDLLPEGPGSPELVACAIAAGFFLWPIAIPIAVIAWLGPKIEAKWKNRPGQDKD